MSKKKNIHPFIELLSRESVKSNSIAKKKDIPILAKIWAEEFIENHKTEFQKKIELAKKEAKYMVHNSNNNYRIKFK